MPTTISATTNLLANHFGNLNPEDVLKQQLESNVGYIYIHAKKSDFTDGGGASGTYAFDATKQIPVGASATLTTVLVNAAATGDTTAVLSVGDGTTAARYNVNTTSIFTAGYVDTTTVGIPSGTKFHSAAKSITLTVTGGSDFTALAAFDIVVCVAYTKP